MNSSNSNPTLMNFCHGSDIGPLISFSFYVVKAILVLPLSILVLYLGLQRQRQQSSFKSRSHSDVFSYHLAAMELFGGPGLICNVCGKYIHSGTLTTAAGVMFSFTIYGEAFFHILTCVDRYLAVVHPIVYLQLRNSRGMKIRNISISCAWIFSLGLICSYIERKKNYVIFSMSCFVGFPIIIVSYCSLSVLYALIHPGPGERSGEKERVDQLKRRAFHTITAILGVLSLWFIGLLTATAVSQVDWVDTNVKCMALSCVRWFSIPSCLVSPLLYLHRSRKLLCICSNSG